MSRESFLASIPFFSSLDADELRDLLSLARPFSFPAGHVIFDQGAAADGMYVLEHGSVQLWARLLGEDEMALARVGPGGIVGEFSLVDYGPRSASAEVVEPAQGYLFSHRQFELLRADHRPAARKVMRQLRAVLCERLRAAAHELAVSTPSFFEHTQRSLRPPPPDTGTRLPIAELDLERLRALPFFSQFPGSDLQALLAPMSAWRLPRGHVLFTEGDGSRSAYVTVRGAVEVIAGRGGAWRRQGILGPGRLFGLVSALDTGPRETSAAMRENAIVLEIHEAQLASLLGEDDPVGYAFTEAVHGAMIEALRATNRTLLAQSAMGRAAQRKKRAASQRPP